MTVDCQAASCRTRRSSAPSGSSISRRTTCSMRVASEPLTSTTSPGTEVCQHGAAPHPQPCRSTTTRSAGSPASRAASAMRRARFPRVTSRSTTRGGLAADLFVPGRLEVAQLDHVAQHRDLAPAFERGQRLQRGFGRGGARGVRVVEDEAAAEAGERVEPARHARHRRQPRDDRDRGRRPRASPTAIAASAA